MTRASSCAASVRTWEAGAVIPRRAQPGAARMVSATRLVSICSMGQKEHKKNIIARGVRPPTLRRMTPPHSNINKSAPIDLRSEEQTSELKSLMRISYAVFCCETTKHRHEQATDRH